MAVELDGFDGRHVGAVSMMLTAMLVIVKLFVLDTVYIYLKFIGVLIGTHCCCLQRVEHGSEPSCDRMTKMVAIHLGEKWSKDEFRFQFISGSHCEMLRFRLGLVPSRPSTLQLAFSTLQRLSLSTYTDYQYDHPITSSAQRTLPSQ